ncbi:hypothetical protein M407DRAFT_196022 [Tulasnella calospora MUT 4182]|uniref:Uncharacterized protein n=1 Tax=Tulasnella calospora MUT 4182 TaxID=1051891 RepID=A0A0C3M021_9AGAM|nr:hypothetical protein M407DRAFT_196022 [Tulasnella calospora MUT 4182]
MNDSTSSYTGESLVNGIAEGLKSFSLAILTPLETEAVFTTLPRGARGNLFVVPDETYLNELDRNENRCTDGPRSYMRRERLVHACGGLAEA